MRFALDGNISFYQNPSRIEKIFKILQNRYGNPASPLIYKSAEQLAIAVILSAQCTDERVNQVTPKLFEKFKNLKSFAEADLKDIESAIYSTGFYRNKAKNIKKLAHVLLMEHCGKMPNNLDTLVNLPGIGRKSANVIMNEIFNKSPGIVVDTHVGRITQRLGFTQKTSPVTIEKDLMNVVPKKLWRDFSLVLIFFGREFCKSRNPNCEACFLHKYCPSVIKEDH